MSWRRAAVDAATIAGFIAVAIGLWVAIGTMLETQKQITVLQDIVNASQKQTESLENIILESQHQTIVNAYSSGGIFDLKITECGKGEKQDENGTYGMYISPKPIMVNDKGGYSIVPFRISMDLALHGVGKGESRYSYYDDQDIGTHIYNPSNPQRFEYHLLQILDEAEKKEYVGLRIDLEYTFRPFSSVHEDLGWIADKSEKQTQILALLKYDEENKKWYILDIRNEDTKVGCK